MAGNDSEPDGERDWVGLIVNIIVYSLMIILAPAFLYAASIEIAQLIKNLVLIALYLGPVVLVVYLLSKVFGK